MKGKKHSEKTRQKISDTQKNMSEESKQKMSEAKKGKLPNNIRKVINNNPGEVYDCAQDVANLLGIPYGTLNNYLLGRRKNKTPYTYLDAENSI